MDTAIEKYNSAIKKLEGNKHCSSCQCNKSKIRYNTSFNKLLKKRDEFSNILDNLDKVLKIQAQEEKERKSSMELELVKRNIIYKDANYNEKRKLCRELIYGVLSTLGGQEVGNTELIEQIVIEVNEAFFGSDKDKYEDEFSDSEFNDESTDYSEAKEWISRKRFSKKK